MSDPRPEELTQAFESIEKANFVVDTLICSECGCTVNNKEEANPPCEHLIELVRDWKNI